MLAAGTDSELELWDHVRKFQGSFVDARLFDVKIEQILEHVALRKLDLPPMGSLDCLKIMRSIAKDGWDAYASVRTDPHTGIRSAVAQHEHEQEHATSAGAAAAASLASPPCQSCEGRGEIV